jgi:hypothetical protein
MKSWSRTLVEGIGISGRVALLAVRGRGRHSPYPVLVRSQLLAAAGLVAVIGGFAVWAPLITAIVVTGVLVVLFSAANALKLVVLRQGLRVPAVLNVSDEELSQIAVDSLPSYTILVSLYREAAMVPRLIAAMVNLGYPTGKLAFQTGCRWSTMGPTSTMRRCGDGGRCATLAVWSSVGCGRITPGKRPLKPEHFRETRQTCS